jgi:two-component system response regulator YesN
MRLLIVDDEVWSRQLIKKIVDWSIYGVEEIVEASNGQEAIKLYGEKNFALTITDMRMPIIDGAELLRYIREEDILTEVIVMSGYEDYKYLHEALKTKAVDYLLKPVVKEDLTKAIKTAIDRINETHSYKHIEEILKREDLRNEFNSYYELKNLLFKSLITTNENQLINYLDQLESRFIVNHLSDKFVQFIVLDLKRFIYRLYKDYDMTQQKVLESKDMTFDEFKYEIMKICVHIKDITLKEKIDILDIQKYIDNHFYETINLVDIAKKYHVSKEHLSRIFKKEVGVSVQNYIIEKRIEYAKRLLMRNGLLSIKTISIMSGYLDLQYFYRVFKRKVGVTPSDYRTSNINIIQHTHQDNPMK